MKIETTLPPNYDAIVERFPSIKDAPGVVFSYGDTLYNPHSTELRFDLVLHERVHAERQANPKEWWDRYITDPAFRLQEELDAYATQYAYLKTVLDAKRAKIVLDLLATDLSGPGYGNLVSYSKAHSLIRYAAQALV